MSKLAKKASERIFTFDLMRGYFLLVILLNHLNFYPNGLGWLTGESILYVSTAEGFFVVSGIVLGIIRGRKLLDQPLKVSAKLLWGRALQLYIASIALTLLFTVIGQLFLGNPGLKYGIFTDWSHWWNLIWQTLTLSYTYGWADFLRYYALFLAFAPLFLWFLRKGYWYIGMALSLGVWCLFPLSPLPPELSQPISWQLVFFGGFTIGYYWQTILDAWRSLSLKTRHRIRVGFVAAFIATATASFALVFGHILGGAVGEWLTAAHHGIEQGFNKDRLPLTRVLLGVIWFWGLFALFRRYESWLKKRLGWLLMNFGANSLYVYTISAFVVFFTHLLIAPPGLSNWILNLLVSIAAVSIVLLAVKTKFLMKIIPR